MPEPSTSMLESLQTPGFPRREGRGVSPSRPFTAYIVFAVGVLSVALLIGSDTLRRHSADRDARLLLAIAEIRTSVALSHLWLEEYVTGDAVEIGDIFDHIDRALALLDGMLGSGIEAPRISVTQGALLNRLTALRSSIEDFAAIATERRQGYERALPVGIGSTLDIEYDRVFDDLLTQTRQLEQTFEARRARHERRSQLIFWLIVSSWGALLTAAAAGLWRRERCRYQAESELEQSRRQLLQSQKLEALGRLAGGLAHDINNYLAAIRGQCELVRTKHPSGEILTRKMDAVIATVTKTSALIDRLLVFSRRQPVELEVAHLGTVVESILGMIRPSLGENVEICSRVAANLWNIEADVVQIEQALVNLLVNARDAMPAGGRIDIRCANRRSADGNDEVALTVSDTGRGIAPRDLDSIFEPFWSTKDQGRSGGLGLATVYSIVEQHGGSINVCSDLGRGTSFEIRLPRCPQTAIAERSGSEAAPPAGDCHSPFILSC